jgi:Mg2+-importing ATPase
VLADPRLCFRGSSVTAGCGTAVVLATGADTFLGAACRSGQVVRRATAVDRTTRSVAGLLIRLTLVALTGAVSVLALAGRDPLTVFPFCVAVAVGLTPEMLPVVVSAALAGARGGLRRRKVIVKRLSAVHDLGAVDVVCADKTGTLTRDRLTVAAGVDPAGSPDPHVVGWAGLNSTISAQLGDPPVVDGIDQALIEALDGPEQTGAGPGASAWVGERVLPFDPVRRCASVVVTARDRPASRVLIVKGAVREVLARCTRWQDGGGCHPLDAAGRAAAGTVADRLAAQGLRVVAVARSAAHPGSPPARPGRGPIRESDLTLLGFVGLCEEPEPTAPAVLAELPEHGIAVKIITGDQARTVVRACADLGVLVERVVTGHDLDDLDDEAVTALARTGTVFAECTPAHKARIVQALRTAGHTVAYLGDGANDAAALRVADVGICPLGGVQAARADADVLLGEHGVAAVGRAVSAGRRAVTNIGTYLRITLACNVGNVIAMVISGATLPFLPMLPAQVLVQNICFDAAQVPLAFDRPAPGHPHSPLDWRRLGREALLLGLVNAAADLATFALIARLSSSAGGTSAAIFFHSGWFSENLLTQAITVHVLRGWTSGRGSRTPWPVRTACLGLAGTGLVLPVSPAAGPLGLHPMPAGYYLGLVPILAGYATVLLILRARTRRPRA